ncbi:hypothetical protein [Streptomyces sp. NBC_01285]|uniref:hypothetical protein n=1 Tax=Streptomyces sp. NBC_01285 TaxID=2903813 RepID=UPI00225B6C41|nr:hypothetical protein [Streptomyces sp. NBC_01285]MCX4774022.1 hypothetical protein [Streptomyces sp. NBC_01285]
MPEDVNPIPVPLTGPVLELAKVRAALAAGLTVDHAVRLQGADEAALTADAVAFAAELSAANPVPQGPRAGGSRGADVGAEGARGTVGAGVAAYREKHGLAENGQRPPVAPRVSTGRITNPYVERGYETEHN